MSRGSLAQLTFLDSPYTVTGIYTTGKMVVRSGCKNVYWIVTTLAMLLVKTTLFVTCEAVRGVVTYSIVAKIIYQTNPSCFS